MTYHLGQRIPYTRPRGIVAGPEIQPEWYALVVNGQRMERTRDRLTDEGVPSFYPGREVERRDKRGKRVMVERPYISGLIYSQFWRAPQWDVLKSRGWIYGVVSYGCMPVLIPTGVIRHLSGMTVEQQRLESARAELRRVREGDLAKMTKDTPLSDYLVQVTEIKGGTAWLTISATGFGSREVPMRAIWNGGRKNDGSARNNVAPHRNII